MSVTVSGEGGVQISTLIHFNTLFKNRVSQKTENVLFLPSWTSFEATWGLISSRVGCFGLGIILIGGVRNIVLALLSS